MSFKDLIAADAKNILNTNELAETITYLSFASVVTLDDEDVTYDGEDVVFVAEEGTEIEISALVVREQTDSAPESYGTKTLTEYEVSIANDASVGVTAVAKGKDQVQIALTPGGTKKSFLVKDILHFDDGMFRLLIGR